MPEKGTIGDAEGDGDSAAGVADAAGLVKATGMARPHALGPATQSAMAATQTTRIIQDCAPDMPLEKCRVRSLGSC